MNTIAVMAVVAALATGYAVAVLRRTLDDIRATLARLASLREKRWGDVQTVLVAVVVLSFLLYLAE